MVHTYVIRNECKDAHAFVGVTITHPPLGGNQNVPDNSGETVRRWLPRESLS